jgi:DNA-binding transcriptional LysR family regulator
VQFRQLEYLVAVAEEKHFARAAAVCSVSQPALSEGIQRLERELGVAIVNRGHRFEGLTPEGELVVAWGRRILAERDGLDADLRSFRGDLSGQLRIAHVPSAMVATSTIVDAFLTAHPLVTATVSADLPATTILERLHDFDLDVGVSYLDDLPDDCDGVPLYREEFVAVVAGGLVDRAWLDRGIEWRELSELPLCLLGPSMRARRLVDRASESAGVTLRPRLEADSVASLHTLVATGGWASVMPMSWLRASRFGDEVRVIPLAAPPESLRLGLVLRHAEFEPALVAAFRAEATASASLLDPSVLGPLGAS